MIYEIPFFAVANTLLHILVYESAEPLLRDEHDDLELRVVELLAQGKLIEHRKDVSVNVTMLNKIFELVHNARYGYVEQFRNKLTYPYLYIEISGVPV